MKIIPYIKRPRLYESHTKKFWDDPYIAQNMLKAHLEFDNDLASRNYETVKKSVDFIESIAPPSTYKSICDLGCGPGLYTDLFQKRGYDVTGIDISNHSINYAKSKNAHVHYQVKNYLDIDEHQAFDVITMIYCDYAVLPKKDRLELLKRIYKALKKDGLFMLDGFTEKYIEALKEEKTWFYDEKGGFFSDSPYLCLKATYKYPSHIFVEQYTIMDEMGETEVIRNWNEGFSEQGFKQELLTFPFKFVSIYQDFMGNPLNSNSETMMIIVKK
ncbi:MAG: class I SAM-dependent methyltransferase [Candidatus Izemoplasmataceae bacterium]